MSPCPHRGRGTKRTKGEEKGNRENEKLNKPSLFPPGDVIQKRERKEQTANEW
jgi:hypothetical protein